MQPPGSSVHACMGVGQSRGWAAPCSSTMAAPCGMRRGAVTFAHVPAHILLLRRAVQCSHPPTPPLHSCAYIQACTLWGTRRVRMHVKGRGRCAVCDDARCRLSDRWHAAPWHGPHVCSTFHDMLQHAYGSHAVAWHGGTKELALACWCCCGLPAGSGIHSYIQVHSVHRALCLPAPSPAPPPCHHPW